MLNLNQRGVDIFIKRFNNKNQESFWEGYQLLIWKKNINGYTDVKGLFRKNSWGTAEKIDINSQGVWKLPGKYVKYFK